MNEPLTIKKNFKPQKIVGKRKATRERQREKSLSSAK